MECYDNAVLNKSTNYATRLGLQLKLLLHRDSGQCRPDSGPNMVTFWIRVLTVKSDRASLSNEEAENGLSQ